MDFVKTWLTFDWSFKGICHSDHDISAKHPEDVVDKKSTEKDAACHNVVKVEHFNSTDGKCNAEEVVSNPVLKGHEQNH